MRVYLWPSFGEESGQGGIKRVWEALRKWLPNYGVEIVDDIRHADLVNTHADDYVTDLPVAASSHGLYWSGYSWPNWCYEANRRLIGAVKRAQAVSVPSQWVANAYARGMLLSPFVLLHGIEPEEWQPEKSEGFVFWGKTRPDPVCDPEPVNQLARMAPDAKFVTTFGDESLSNVSVIGKQKFSSTALLIKKAGVYLGTVMETGGITCLEAMACGVPVLGFDWGANSEIVQHKETGYLVKPYDYAALREGLDYCQKNRSRLGDAARQCVLENYTWQERIKAYLPFYEAALTANTFPVKVSVVVTAYNLADYLPACLQSLIDQDFSDWECIVVDDASPDQCGEIAENFAHLDSRFRVIHNRSNRYLAEARNIGLRAARGKYLIPLDADDMLGRSALGILSRALDKDKDLDIVTGGFELIDPDGRHWQSGWPSDHPAYGDQIQQRNQVPYASLFRRWVWERTGGYRRRHKTAEDADFWTRAMSFGAVSDKVTDAPTLIYSNRPDSMSHAEKMINWTDWYVWAKIPELSPFGAVAAGSAKTAENVHAYSPPEISVIIPCGPGHDVYLQDVLDSLVGQTFLNWEAVVINDTGVSWFGENGRLNNKYLAGFPFVRVVEDVDPRNRGVAWARNAGIRASRAPVFVLMDADDYMQPMMLDILFKVYSLYGGWVYSDWYKDQGEIQAAKDWSAEGLVEKMLGPSTGLYAKKDWETIGGFDENAPGWEDWSAQLSLLEHGICGTRVSQPLFTYRYRTGNRREDNYARGKEVLEYIKRKHQNLFRRETIMACKSCGGGGGKETVTVGVGSSSAPGNPMVLVEYTGPAEQRMTLRSRVDPRRQYRYGGIAGSPERRFYVYKGDVDWITNMKDFSVVHVPDTSIRVPVSLPVRVDAAPAPNKEDQPLSVIGLAPEIVTVLGRSGYTTLGDIRNLSLADLVSIRGMGQVRARKVQDAISAFA